MFDLILLIDDNEADNFYHKMVIEDENMANEVVIMNSGQKALDYLSTTDEGEYPSPDLILLDINMPGMDGWEFLEHYDRLEEEMQAHVIVVMLTTSHDPNDLQRATSRPGVVGLKNKPLTPEMLREILENYF